MTRSSKNVFWKTVAALLAAVMVLALVPAAMLRPAAELASEVPVLNETVVGTVKFQSFNFLGKNASGDDGVDYSATFYYTDDYFAHSAVNDAATAQKMPWTALDDVSLAACSMDLAVASYATAAGDVVSASPRTWDNTDYSDRAANAREFLTACGFSNFENYDYDHAPERDGVAYVIASKQIHIYDEVTQQNKDFTLIAVGVRGAGYGAEWASNVEIGTPGNGASNVRHEGFDGSARKVRDGVKTYLQEQGISGDVKYWVSGFSRAAAVANLTAGYLTDEAADFYTTQDDVYGYTWECPQGAAASENALNYKNIHNIVNAMDVVPMVSPSVFEHQRLGVDYVMPYYGNTTSSENTEYYERMYRVLNSIAVGTTFKDGTYEEDPLIAAVDPDNYPYNRPVPIYTLTAGQLISDAISGDLMTNFGTKLATGSDNKLGSVYMDQFLENVLKVCLRSGAWNRHTSDTCTSDTASTYMTHKETYIDQYQSAFQDVFAYFLDFSGPAFMDMVDAVMDGIQEQLRISNTLTNGGLALAFTNFYNYPDNTYRWAWQSGFKPWVGSTSWVGKTRKDVLIKEAQPVVRNVVHNMVSDYEADGGCDTVTLSQLDAALDLIVEVVIDLYADELSQYNSNYFGTTLHYLNTILSTHEQETVLSWITSLDDNHMNRSYRTLTVPVGTNVKLYEFREQYGETLSANGVAPLVAEFTNGTQVSSLDQRIYMESNGTTMTIRYPSSLDIRSDVTLAPGSSAVSDLDYRVADFQTKQDTTDVSVGVTQFQTLSNTARYTEITNTTWTNAAAVNSASASEAVALGPYDTLKVMANGSTSFDNHNAGDEAVYTVKVERYHAVTLQEVLVEGSEVSSATFDLELTLTPPAGTEVPADGMDIRYEDEFVHFEPVVDPASSQGDSGQGSAGSSSGQSGTPTYVALTTTLEDLSTDDPPFTIILPEGWTLTLNQPSDGSYQTQGYTLTPADETAIDVDGETASIIVSKDTDVVIRNFYYLPPPTGMADGFVNPAPVLFAIVGLGGSTCVAALLRRKDEFLE